MVEVDGARSRLTKTVEGAQDRFLYLQQFTLCYELSKVLSFIEKAAEEGVLFQIQRRSSEHQATLDYWLS